MGKRLGRTFFFLASTHSGVLLYFWWVGVPAGCSGISGGFPTHCTGGIIWYFLGAPRDK